MEGQYSIIGDAVLHAEAGDFFNIPAGTVYCFSNSGTAGTRMILTFTPAGMEGFFQEALESPTDRNAAPPQNNSAVTGRYVVAAAKYGLEFVPLRTGNRHVRVLAAQKVIRALAGVIWHGTRKRL